MKLLMAATITLCSMFFFENDYDYNKAWAEVNSFIEKRLPKSALEKVEEIYAYSVKENNSVQQIKSLKYIASLTIETHENGVDDAIVRLNSELDRLNGSSKAILQSYLAEIYRNYFYQNRYNISQRTNLAETESSDFKSWTSSDFYHQISRLFLASVSHPKDLSADISGYKEIVDQIKDGNEQFRPTMYYLLMDRCLEFFNSGDNIIPKPVNSFELSAMNYLDNSDNFISLEIPDNDSLSNEYQLLKAYQNVLRHSKNLGQISAFLNYDLNRLNYLYYNTNSDKKVESYISALEYDVSQYSENNYVAQLKYELNAFKYHNLRDSIDIDEIINDSKEVIEKYPNTTGAANSQALIDEIHTRNLSFIMPSYVPSESAIEVKFNYQNIDSGKLELYKSERINELLKNGREPEIRRIISSMTPFYTQEIALPITKKYLPNEAKMVLPPQKLGTYLLVFRHGDDLVFNTFQVTDLMGIHFQEGSNYHILVTNRTSGEPIENAVVKIYSYYYNRFEQREDKTLIFTLNTNRNGEIIFPITDKEHRSISFSIKKGQDEFLPEDRDYLYYQYPTEEYEVVEIYTDRAIYRPGQTVYFKALALNYSKERIPTIVKGAKVSLNVYDVNNQSFYTHDFVTNEFGTCSGSFELPKGKMNGNFRIDFSGNHFSGEKYIRVEEYKRPNFEVTIDKPKEQIVVGDSVTFSLHASNYSGTPLQDAKVKYTIKRTSFYPYWPWYRSYINQGEEAILLNGNAMTDDKGNLLITFLAEPDKSLRKKDNPNFNFEIEAFVTDINGETQSTKSSLVMSYTALNLSLNKSGVIDVSDLNDISLLANNAIGEKQKAVANVQILKLEEPKCVQVSPNAAIPIINQNEFKKWFPKINPNYDSNFDEWKTEKQIGSFTISTEEDFDWKEKIKNSGVYRLIFTTKDVFGNEVEMNAYLEVTDFDKSEFPMTKYLFHKANKSAFQPGDEVVIDFGTPDPTVNLYLASSKENKLLQSSWKKVDNTNQFRYHITDSDRGGFGITLFYVKNNQVFTENIRINVPWSEKRLKFTFETFRDKVLPGSDELWKLKISGEDKELVMAEILASMYDASLDAFARDEWKSEFYPSFVGFVSIRTIGDGQAWSRVYIKNKRYQYQYYQVPSLNGINLFNYRLGARMAGVMDKTTLESIQVIEYKVPLVDPQNSILNEVSASNLDGIAMDSNISLDSTVESVSNYSKEPILTPRKNLNETVFFYPHILTDSEGNFVLKFKMNEALTKWKLRLLGITTDLKVGYEEAMVQTQKELMIFPNLPRFLREKDQITLNAKISNTSDTLQRGRAQLKIFDAITEEDITSKLLKTDSQLPFTLDKESSESFKWNLEIPSGISAIKYQFYALGSKFSDGEEGILPLVTNRTLVTETLPIMVKAGEDKSFVFEALKNNNSSSKIDHKYSIEVTENPIWYAIQSLPYLMEYPYECTEQVLNRYYANQLATQIANSHPKIKAVFDQWKNFDSDQLISNLSKNEELKTAILEETPWVLDAKSEEQQKKNIALLFDLNRMAYESENALNIIISRQYPSGGFPWFNGGRENDYITQYVIESLAHLQKLGIQNDRGDISDLIIRAIDFIDLRLENRYEILMEQLRRYGGNPEEDHLDPLSIHYLYVRSFFTDKPIPTNSQKAYDYYYSQAKRYWNKKNLYHTGLIGITMNRTGQKTTAETIFESLKQRSFYNENVGRYWNEGNGYHWDELPIERQSLLIEFFTEMNAKSDFTDELKLWLLNNKRTNRWETTKGTASAIYALLMNNGGQLNDKILVDNEVQINIGNTRIEKPKDVTSGSSYYKVLISDDEKIEKNLANIKINNIGGNAAWFTAYYQYFEDIDKVEANGSGFFNISKEYYLKENTDAGTQLVKLTDERMMKVGDIVTVRLILRSDRSMEFVHLKDMRPSCLEPLSVISRYQWKSGMGYYESTRDLSSNYFIDYLPKGTFVLEYDTKVSQSGVFASGMAQLQCMYAPEFSSHSSGEKMNVE